MEEQQTKTWIDAMIEREAIPKPARLDTIEEFCKKWGVAESTYDYQRRKKENKRKVVEIWLSEAINDGNEVLRKLGEKAREGDVKAIELYMKFVLELADNLNIKTDLKITGELTKEQKAILDKLYDKQINNGQDSIGDTSGEVLPVQ